HPTCSERGRRSLPSPASSVVPEAPTASATPVASADPVDPGEWGKSEVAGDPAVSSGGVSGVGPGSVPVCASARAADVARTPDVARAFDVPRASDVARAGGLWPDWGSDSTDGPASVA